MKFVFNIDKIEPNINNLEEGFMFPLNKPLNNNLYKFSSSGNLAHYSSYSIPYIPNPTNKELTIKSIKLTSYNFKLLYNQNPDLTSIPFFIKKYPNFLTLFLVNFLKYIAFNQ